MTQLTPIAKVVINPDRQRKEFDEGKLTELLDSISNPGIGLLHPPVLRRKGDNLILVAGERRLRAIKDAHELGIVVYLAGQPIPTGMLPYLDLGEMDPIDAEEAELEENIKRTDLTWQERAKATSRLMDLRKAQALRDGTPEPTVADIAQEVRGISTGGQQSDTRDEIILARYLHDPDVAGAASPAKAIKILKRKEEQARNTRIGVELGKTMTGASHTLLNGDSEVLAKDLTPGRFAVILMDPPYGMDADNFGDSGGMAEGNHAYSDDEDFFFKLMGWLPEQTFRLAKTDAHLYCFCDIDKFTFLKETFAAVGWKVFRTPLIWHKPNGFRAPWPDMGPQRRYEICLYAVKGDRKTVRLAGDLITIPPDENLGHSAQKPVALYADLLSRSSIPGEEVLDLFAGTGPIFPAAHQLKVRATGIELDPASYAIAAKRIQELK